MELPSLLMKIMLTIVLLRVVQLLAGVFNALILKPRRLCSNLRKQGIRGPSPSFLVGNILEMMKAVPQVPQTQGQEANFVHNSSAFVFPVLEKWTQQFGTIFMISHGNIQYLHMNDPEVLKELLKCTSLELGSPQYLQILLGPLLGRGILTSNGANWSHKRKTLASPLTLDSVKGMRTLMVDSAVRLVDAWKAEIESGGGVAEITVDAHLISFTTDIMSKACFGSDNSNGKEIFIKISAIFENMTKRILYTAVPLLRYLPTKSNIEANRLENDVRRLILNVAEQRNQASIGQHTDIFQAILEGTKTMSESGGESADRFIVDNLKNIFLAGYETVAVSAAWTLMLLATNPEWQERARAEVFEICGRQNPNDDMVRKMKILTMVLHESLRLYPPVTHIPREALQDLKIGDIHVPKGCHTWVTIAKLHQDTQIWGLDAHQFNPQRFANGVSGSCKQPHVFMPFGIGPRNCLGQNFALAELKILFALILSNFSFSLSPNYRHSPVQKLLLKPEHGVTLLIKKL